MRSSRPLRIVSGGQSGVDRAALDAALAAGIACGGWCPRGRRAEDGVIDARYPLHETPQRDYRQRTEWNVRDSDATLILHRGGPLRGGTALTRDLARRWERPCRVVDLAAPGDLADLLYWLRSASIAVLNVAGPRESQQPGIQQIAQEYLMGLIAAWRESADG